MSANNAVLVLKCKDQYRVAYSGCPENIYWSWIIEDQETLPVPTRVIQQFCNSVALPNVEEAIREANRIYDSIGYLEYGIMVVDMRLFTWKQILENAKIMAVKEGAILSQKDHLKWKDELMELSHILLLT